jgi:hypothetical protein
MKQYTLQEGKNYSTIFPLNISIILDEHKKIVVFTLSVQRRKVTDCAILFNSSASNSKLFLTDGLGAMI